MNFINDHVLNAILTTKNDTKASSIRVLNWHLNSNVVKIGNNYCTQVAQLTIRYQIQNDDDDWADNALKPEEKTFFLKSPCNAAFYDWQILMGGYTNEVTIYTKVLPKMYTFEDEYFTPRLYHFADDMSLVLEDLSQSGYKCYDRIQQLDFQHCFYALKHLAKFHATSVKLEKIQDGLSESVKRDKLFSFNVDSPQGEITMSFVSQIPTFVDNLPQHVKDRYPTMVTYIENLSNSQTLTNMANNLASSSTFNVLNHGDFWTNNVMFKYDKHGTIKKVKLIDFQLTSWASPVKDLIFFTITSMKFEVYLKYFPLLLKTYLDELNTILLRLDCPTYNLSNLLDDMDTAYDFALIVLCSVLPVLISDPDDPIDGENMCKDLKLQKDTMAKIYKHRYFQKTSVKWFEHFARKGTLRIDEKNISNLVNTGE